MAEGAGCGGELRGRLLLTADTTRERLIVAAERLFAEHGFDGVTLKQITAEAGQRNASALQYHFGSRVDLVRAIVAEFARADASQPAIAAAMMSAPFEAERAAAGG